MCIRDRKGLPLCKPEQWAAAVSSASTSFYNAGVDTCTTMTQEGVLWQTIIHCVFILSAIGIAWTDKLMSNGHSKSHDKAHDH